MTATAAREPIPLDDLLSDFATTVRPPLEDLLERHPEASWARHIGEWLSDYDDQQEPALSEIELVCLLIALRRCVAATTAAEREGWGPGRVRVGDRIVELDIEGAEVATAALVMVAAIAEAAHPGRGAAIFDKATRDLEHLMSRVGAGLRLSVETFDCVAPIGPAF